MSSEWHISHEQARINIAAAQEAIDYARANGLRVLPHWQETIKLNEEVLRSAETSPYDGTDHSRSRSLEPSTTRVASHRPSWYLPSSDETASVRPRSNGAARAAPELVETPSGFEITLEGMVAQKIKDEVLETLWRYESREVETGGWLYALYRPSEDGVSIVHASGPGNGNQGSGWVELGAPSEIEAGFDDVLARARLVRVGDWHSHPWRDDTPFELPSDADLATWARHSDDAGVLPFVSVIVTPGEVGWMTPELHGWVTREREDCCLVAQPAVLRGV